MAEGESLEDTLSAGRLADLIERHGPRVLEAVVSALRDTPDSAPATAGRAQNGGQGVEWHAVGTIKSFDHKWPGVHEHYPPMTVYEGRDQMGLVRFCIGVPQERMKVHGRERGWASVWEVVNGQPREQRAVFLETDDFTTTGDRVALIAGKSGKPRQLFEPGEEPQLPSVYAGMRIAVHRDVCTGPYAKNRLGVLARDDEVQVMLDHALAHLRLRTR